MKKIKDFNSSWFLQQLLNQGLTQRGFAKAMKMDPSAISRLLKGERKLGLEDATQVASILSLPIEDVLYNAGISVDRVESKDGVKIVGWVDGNSRIHLGTVKSPRTTVAPGLVKEDMRVLRCQTTGSATIGGLDGALIYFKRISGVSGDSVGRLCIVETTASSANSGSGANDTYLAVLNRGYQAGSFKLVRLDGSVLIEETGLSSASPVLWLKL